MGAKAPNPAPDGPKPPASPAPPPVRSLAPADYSGPLIPIESEADLLRYRVARLRDALGSLSRMRARPGSPARLLADYALSALSDDDCLARGEPPR